MNLKSLLFGFLVIVGFLCLFIAAVSSQAASPDYHELAKLMVEFSIAGFLMIYLAYRDGEGFGES